MPDLIQPYDEFAAHYDLIFENWDASIARQAAVLTRILNHECGDARPIRVLDCACGIGTQSLGLAMNGFDVTGCDVSSGAIQRARSEASKRGLSIPFFVANMTRLSPIPQSNFDAVICIDNALPHGNQRGVVTGSSTNLWETSAWRLLHRQHSRLRSIACGKTNESATKPLFG